MNCAQCRRICLEEDAASLPADVAEHLVECADCRKAQQRIVALGQLLALKRFEQPDAHFETRLLAKVESSIRDLDPRPAGWLDRVWNAWSGERIPALRIAMSLLVMGLVGLNMLSLQQTGPLTSLSIEAQREAPTAPALADAGTTNHYFDPTRPIVFISSNTQPTGIRYGTGPSRLVGFEY